MKCQAVIFDLDGTLLDSLADIAEACNQVLGRAGFCGYTLDVYRQWIGAGMRHLLHQAVPEVHRTPPLVDRLLPLLAQQYRQNCTVRSRLYSGITEMLGHLENSGIKKAILSNKPDLITQLCVDHFLHGYAFVSVVGQRESVPRKPDPQSALEIARKMDVNPAEILYVGDTGIDIQTAKNAGFRSFGVTWGFRPEELSAAGAEHIGHSPGDILEQLEGNAP